jgi:hypothetical protein
MRSVPSWEISLAEFDQTESVLAMFQSGEYKKCPGYPVLEKTFRIGILKRPAPLNQSTTQALVFKSSQMVR